MVTVTRYGTRNWAVWLDGELVVVALYKVPPLFRVVRW